VFSNLFDWLDHRTGYRKLMDAMLLEHIPGGAKWRYVWGSCLAFVFSIQLITGVLLMLHYSPGDSTAWGSVFFIQYEMDFGWLIRGLHHFGSQTMVVLLALHMLQVVIAGAQLPPREFNWWLGLALMGIVLGLSLTGYLLPWDQKGYFATRVATNIAGNMPVIGPYLQRVVVGGPEYGNHTLTQFFTLHVGILPPLLIVLLIAHLAVFRRHGVTAPVNARGEGNFWPDQAFRDMLACMVVFGIMLSLVIFGGHGNKVNTKVNPEGDHSEPGLYERWAKAGQDGLGANLDAPADRDSEGYPARPEWYFLFLFQLLKYFEGPLFLVGTVFIPNGVMVILILLPLFGYGRMRPFGHALGVIVVVALIGGVATLTFLAMVDDSTEPILGFSTTDKDKAKDFRDRLEVAEKEAQRAVQLAYFGIPQEGARELLRNDPKTRGPKIFGGKCASCHNYTAHGMNVDKDFQKRTASDLSGYGTYDWVRGLLTNPADAKYFGLARKKVKNDKGEEEDVHLEGMINWRKKIDRNREKWKNTDPKKIVEQDKEFDLIAKFVVDQAQPKDKRDMKLDKEARELFIDTCASCHNLDGEGGTTAPDLTDYASADWIRLMLMNPGHESRYGDNNLMPAFRPLDGPGAQVPLLEFKQANDKRTSGKMDIIELSDADREVLIRWMIGDPRVVFGGQPIAGSVREKKK
jgi:ubiquinol-cytochrome c reductase cytochrome b subunit